MIELLFVITLLAILTSFGLSSVSFLVQRNEQQIIYDEIKTIINYAKLKAIELDRNVYLLSLDPNLDWSKGILLCQWDKQTKSMRILNQWPCQHPHWLLTWIGADSQKRLRFSNIPANAISNGKFVLTNTQSKEQKIIIINRLGRVRDDV